MAKLPITVVTTNANDMRLHIGATGRINSGPLAGHGKRVLQKTFLFMDLCIVTCPWVGHLQWGWQLGLVVQRT